MRYIIWLIVLFLLLLLQNGVLAPLHIGANLILIVTAMAAILSDFDVGIVITITGGVLLDFVSGSVDGTMSISLLATFLLMYFLFNEVLPKETSLQTLFFSAAGSTIVFFLIVLTVTRNPDFRYILVHRLWLNLIWNLILTYPIFRLYLFVQNVQSFRNRTSNQP